MYQVISKYHTDLYLTIHSWNSRIPMALGRGHHICSNSAPKSVDNSKQNRNTRKMISVLSGKLRGASGWTRGANDAEFFRSGAHRHSLTHFSHVQLHSNLMVLSLFPITALALSFSLSLFLFGHLSFSLDLTHYWAKCSLSFIMEPFSACRLHH